MQTKVTRVRIRLFRHYGDSHRRPEAGSHFRIVFIDPELLHMTPARALGLRAGLIVCPLKSPSRGRLPRFGSGFEFTAWVRKPALAGRVPEHRGLVPSPRIRR